MKGLRALEAADVIVADRLGARAVLDGLAADGVDLRAEVIDVGKLPGHHAVPQDAINALLVQLARDGKTVVRLKGGDPYVFGRGGEELEHCRQARVDVEVVSGVTSAISVPALAGIPLTHRGVATAFTVATGHDQIRELGGGRDHTVVLLMGVGTLAHAAITLARGERGAECPVAIIEDGFGRRSACDDRHSRLHRPPGGGARRALARGRGRGRRRPAQHVCPRADRHARSDELRTARMTYVIALPCVDLKDRACIDECPVDCIYEGDRMLYIHPDECVDCGACEPVCPVEAIYYEDDVPDEWRDYYTANVEFFAEVGSPGGAAKTGVIAGDHPLIAALPPQETEHA